MYQEIRTEQGGLVVCQKCKQVPLRVPKLRKGKYAGSALLCVRDCRVGFIEVSKLDEPQILLESPQPVTDQ